MKDQCYYSALISSICHDRCRWVQVTQHHSYQWVQPHPFCCSVHAYRIGLHAAGNAQVVLTHKAAEAAEGHFLWALLSKKSEKLFDSLLVVYRHVIVLLQDLDALTSDTRILWYTEDFIVNSNYKVSRYCGCKMSPNHQPSTTVLDDVFLLLHCVWFLPNVVLNIITKHHLWSHLILWFVQMKHFKHQPWYF